MRVRLGSLALEALSKMRWRPINLLVFAVASACSAEQATNAGSHGIHTPLQAAQPEDADATPLRRVDFRTLSAFLADPRYEAVRSNDDDGRYEEAVAALESAYGAALTSGKLDLEQWFQLGLLQRKAGRVEAAAVSFENAAKEPWALRDYARYFAALARAAAGQERAALAHLDKTPPGMAFSVRAGLLEAETRLRQGDKARAVVGLKVLLQGEPRPDGWPDASLRLARALLQSAPASSTRSVDLVDALSLCRRVSLELAGTSLALESQEVERDVLAQMTTQDFELHAPLTLEQELVRLGALVEQRHWEDASIAAQELLQKSATKEPFSALDCEARLLRSKAQAGIKAWGKAVDQLGDALALCKGEDLRARLRFSAGKFAQSDKRWSTAIRIFSDLEVEAPTHRLADDSRIRRAQSYLELGDEAKFTELLGSITLDYPDGDVALDGLFELALRRIEKADWSQAANVLERAFPRAERDDLVRDHEFAGRERYFRARAFAALGDNERALTEYERLIEDRPLSYYMLLAFSRLEAEDPSRASAALERALQETKSAPFAFAHRPEFDGDVFQRALALARHGEIDWAQKELESLAVLDQPDLLWAVALLYGRAGAPYRSHAVARGKLHDWLSRWPVGDWRAPWELAFPRPYLPIVERVAKKEGVPEHLVYAVMREESAFRPDVVSHADAYGLMQLIRPTAKHFGTKLGLPHDEAALKRPSVNIALGASVLGNYGKAFPNNPLLVIPGYNAGPGRPKRWLAERAGLDFDVWVELIPFTETRRYTKRVLSSRSAYAYLYGDADPSSLELPLRLEPD
jgi:soluble lytic murein transglycosylase